MSSNWGVGLITSILGGYALRWVRSASFSPTSTCKNAEVPEDTTTVSLMTFLNLEYSTFSGT
eukprot:2382783-Amphidinium_carterae.1